LSGQFGRKLRQRAVRRDGNREAGPREARTGPKWSAIVILRIALGIVLAYVLFWVGLVATFIGLVLLVIFAASQS
jgi:hypothetical protein